MGCGAGALKEAKAEEKDMICSAAAKEMMTICLAQGMTKGDQIKVKAPPDVASLRETVKQLRQGGEDLKKSLAGESPEKPKEEAKKEGGMMGMMAGAINKAADVATAVAGDVAGKGANLALSTMADALEKCIDAVEKPFTEVGKEVVAEKKDKINEISAGFIQKLPLGTGGKALEICRGKAPHGMPEYQAVPPNSIIAFMATQNANDWVQVLQPEIADAIQKHTVTKVWKSLIDNYNSLSDQIAKLDIAKQFSIELKPIALDLNNYIVIEMVKELARIMGEDEATIRKAGTHQAAKKKIIFDAVFSGATITANLVADGLNA